MSSETNTIQSSDPKPAIDPYSRLKIVPNPDGTITRTSTRFPEILSSSDPHLTIPVLSKDILVNSSTGTCVRIFLPQKTTLLHDNNLIPKLPLILHCYGSGFILPSPTNSLNHNYCLNMALDLNTVIVSVKHRLAPEHRLPAAYDDYMDALHWVKNADEVWLRDYADFSNCFLSGSCTGGNVVYQVGLRVAAQVDKLAPLKIQGLIINRPFFGGAQICESEVKFVNDPLIPPGVPDLMWDLSLPNGVDRDHEYCNPTAYGGSKLLDKMRLVGWKVLVSGYSDDPLIDRWIELVKMMKEKGIRVESWFGEGGFHGVEMYDPSKTNEMLMVFKNFMFST